MMTPFAKSYKVLDGIIGNIGNVYKVFDGLLFMKNLKVVFFFFFLILLKNTNARRIEIQIVSSIFFLS